MRVSLRDGLLVVIADSDEERAQVEAWAARHDGHAFALRAQGERTFRMTDLGPRPDACREPINVTSRAADPEIRILSNFAHAPFVLDGAPYASVEAFWQGLKFTDPDQRRMIALLHGADARKAGQRAPQRDTLDYGGRTIRIGTAEHWALMHAACEAKFAQHEPARRALLATGDRPLEHRMRRDSVTIPGVVMADIWMRIRRALRECGDDSA